MKTIASFRVLAAAFALLGTLLPTELRAQDLPYSSGSTGADGSLNIPTVFPNQGPLGGAVYHEAEGAVYYISSYFVWKTLDGVTWSRLADVPNPWSSVRGHLCYDSNNGILYALIMAYFYDGNWQNAPRCYKLNGTNWEPVGTGLPNDGTWGYSMYGRIVWDSSRQQIFSFGSGENYNQTWTFDGTTWTQQSPTTSPPGRMNPQMAYDPMRQEIVLFGGQDPNSGNKLADTWVWNGTNWIEKPFILTPPAMSDCGALWHPGYQGVTIPYTGKDLWIWNGTEWRLEHASGLWSDESKSGFCSVYHSGSDEMLSIADNRVMSLKNGVWSYKIGNPYYIDLKTRPSGVFNYTDIVVPSGMTVKFLRNSANTPVVWMASGFVQVGGTVDVSGSGSAGGPGGYDGADGLMLNGQGPGGGYPDDTYSHLGGRYFGTYGNPQIEPLIGGSGGGRQGTWSLAGSGGGGALLIAASRDIQINGSIMANSSSAYGNPTGTGSGGAIKLVADRILGSGSLQADAGGTNSGYPNQTGTPGRIRLEAYETDMVDNGSPLPSSSSSPVWDSGSIASQLEYELKVTHVAGLEVREPPTGQPSSPDVSFSTDQEVTVVVSGRNIPDGTEVKLAVSGNGINVTLPASGDPPVTMQSGGATFNVTIPAGLGNIQASAVFQKPATP